VGSGRHCGGCAQTPVMGSVAVQKEMRTIIDKA
jgi:hypothetical protein